MAKTLKKSCAAFLSLLMILSTLLYFPSGTFAGMDFGLTAQAYTPDTTPSKPQIGDGTNASPYKITSVGELYWFAGLVNGTLEDGTAQNMSANAILMTDLVINENLGDTSGNLNEGEHVTWTPLSNFKGSFNGNKHNIWGFYVNGSSNNVGFVGTLDHGSITNLGIHYSYFKGNDYVGAICGQSDHGVVSNCFSNNYVWGANNVGGICGYSYEGEIYNCCSVGDVSGKSSICGRKVAGTIANCYYQEGLAADGNATAKTMAEFKSGEVAFLLQGDQDDQVWGQNLEKNYAYPCPGDPKVYQNKTYAGCNKNTEVLSVSYSNTEQDVFGEHVGYENGFCTGCDAYQPAQKDADGVYEISNAGQLYWFAGLISGTLTDGTAQDSYASAMLIADIVVNQNVLKADGTLNEGTYRSWTPIGKESARFYRTFDGNNHTISGLYYDNSDSTGKMIGLFGYINGGTVKNVGVIDSYINGYEFIGGISGYMLKGTITNCYFKGTAIANAYIGGICGLNSDTISNCYSMASLQGGEYTGGIAGRVYEKDNVNCYYLSNTDDGQGGKTAAQFASGEVAYLLGDPWGQTIGTDTSPVPGGKKVYQTTGCVTYNNDGKIGEKVHNYVANDQETHKCADCGAEDAHAFTAKLISDEALYADADCTHPIRYYKSCAACGAPSTNTADLFEDGDPLGHDFTVETVSDATLYTPADCTHAAQYHKSCARCDAISTDEADLFASGEMLGHSYNDNGFCERCDAYEAAILNADGAYEISNAGQLYWFAALVNGTLADVDQNMGANGILTADIVVNETVLDADRNLISDPSSLRKWAPISGDSYYTGTFDGQNHTISGLYFNDSKTSVGLFGKIDNTTIRNLGVIDSFFQAKVEVAAVCGYSHYGTIENCYSTATINGTEEYAGGICGRQYYGKISNCANRGRVGGVKNVAGICGFGYGSIVNCYNMGTVTGQAICAVSSYITITNCYALEDSASTYYQASKLSAGAFASGEAAYRLGGVWGQDLSSAVSAQYPSVGGPKVYQCNYYLSCDASDTPTQVYRNVNEDIIPAHSYVNGVCKNCGYFRNNVGTHLAGHSLTLNGSIGVNFYMMLDPRIVADDSAHMKFTLPDGTTKVMSVRGAAQDEVDGEQYYVFTCQVSAKEMASRIKAQIITDTVKSTVYSFTVEDYANEILDNSDAYNSYTVGLVRTLMQYGTYADAYFAGETLGATEEMSRVTADTLAKEVPVADGELPEGISYYGSTLLLESDVVLRHYFKVAEGTDVSAYGFTGNKGNYYYMDLAAGFGVTVADCVIGDYTLKYQPTCYVRAVLESESAPENLKQLVTALYLYYRMSQMS
ncbi:M26 family metallopeptidase [Ruminococcus champanellensis]